MTLEEVFNLVKQLPLVDKVRLIERVAPEIEQELGTLQRIQTSQVRQPHKSLWGLCADLGDAPSAIEIDQARSEVWAGFPRGDI